VTSDGFSIKTTISQLANVARAQVKGQSTQPATPAVEKLLKHDKRVDRIKRNEEVLKQKVDPDRERGQDGAPGREAQSEPQEKPAGELETRTAPDETENAGKGAMLDTKA